MHSMYCLCFTSGVVWVEGKIKLSIVSECVCVSQVQLDDLQQLAGIGTEEHGPETLTLRNTKWQGITIRSLSIY